jgi:transposase
MVTLGLVAALDTVRAQIEELEGEVVERLGTHADAAIFTALPRSGRVRAAALLAEIGDCRARFPDAESLTCLAGAAHRPGVGQAPDGRVRLCLRQEAPGRGHGLRR